MFWQKRKLSCTKFDGIFSETLNKHAPLKVHLTKITHHLFQDL